MWHANACYVATRSFHSTFRFACGTRCWFKFKIAVQGIIPWVVYNRPFQVSPRSISRSILLESGECQIALDLDPWILLAVLVRECSHSILSYVGCSRIFNAEYWRNDAMRNLDRYRYSALHIFHHVLAAFSSHDRPAMRMRRGDCVTQNLLYNHWKGSRVCFSTKRKE